MADIVMPSWGTSSARIGVMRLNDDRLEARALTSNTLFPPTAAIEQAVTVGTVPGSAALFPIANLSLSIALPRVTTTTAVGAPVMVSYEIGLTVPPSSNVPNPPTVVRGKSPAEMLGESLTFLYVRPDDRVFGGVGVQWGTEDPIYPARNLDNSRPEQPAKIYESHGAWTRDIGGTYPIGLVGIINHNFDAGTWVTLEGNSINDWTAPAYTYTFTVPPRRPDRFTRNLWVLVSGHRDYEQVALRYWRLAVIGTAGLSVGEWAMYTTVRNLHVRNVKWGSQRQWRKPSIQHETEMSVQRMFAIGTIFRELQVDIDSIDPVLLQVEDWWRSADSNVRPFLIVPNQQELYAECWMVRFMDPDQPYTREHRNYNVAKLLFRELTPGLYP